MIIDEDLGKSGRTAEGRSGFQRLITEVTLNHVGMVLGLEMSRLARSSKDWHAFFEMCAIFGTLIADADGIYEGNDPNDRLLLGLKGIMSEMELHIMRNRLERGRDNKAQRGELFFSVPVGYVILPTGEVDFDPDEQARLEERDGLAGGERDVVDLVEHPVPDLLQDRLARVAGRRELLLIEVVQDRIVDLEGYQVASYGYSTTTPWHSPREVTEAGMAAALDRLLEGLDSSRPAIFNLIRPSCGRRFSAMSRCERIFSRETIAA